MQSTPSISVRQKQLVEIRRNETYELLFLVSFRKVQSIGQHHTNVEKSCHVNDVPEHVHHQIGVLLGVGHVKGQHQNLRLSKHVAYDLLQEKDRIKYYSESATLGRPGGTRE